MALRTSFNACADCRSWWLAKRSSLAAAGRAIGRLKVIEWASLGVAVVPVAAIVGVVLAGAAIVGVVLAVAAIAAAALSPVTAIAAVLLLWAAPSH